MSAAIVPPFEAAPVDLPRKRFTRGDVERMMAAGVFEGQRYELIDGDLIDKMGQNPPHASAMRQIARIFGRIFDAVQTQLPIDVSIVERDLNVPEPDFAIL